MIFPTTTAIYAALLALLYVGLSSWVVAGRVTGDVLHGEGDETLQKRIRSHGNFAEYVPLALLLVGLLEAGGGGKAVIETLLAILLVARLLHPFGMFASRNSMRQFACRGGAVLATLLVTAVAAVSLLVRFV